jgi:Fe2+ transport system protein FeoA
MSGDSPWVERGRGTTSPSGRPTSPEKVVRQLVEMGFNESKSRKVLQENGGDMTAAVRVLTSMSM